MLALIFERLICKDYATKNLGKLNGKLVLAMVIIILVVILVVFWSGQLTKNITSLSTQYVREFSMPAGTAPNALLVDNRGIVWVTTYDPTNLLSLDPTSGSITNFAVKDTSVPDMVMPHSAMAWTMVQGLDGKIWFSYLGNNYVWQLDSETDTFHAIPSKSGSAFQMKVARDGGIWFTTLLDDTIGVVEKSIGSGYKTSSFETGNNTTPAGLFLQNDSVWTANIESQKISQHKIIYENGFVRNIVPVQDIPSSNVTMFSTPTDLMVYKNFIWLTEHGTSFLARYDIANGTLVHYPTSQNGFHTTTLPFWIRYAENPTVLWFNEHEGNKIGCFDLINETMTEYLVPSTPKDGDITYVLNISQDPRDEKILWFSEWNTDKIGVINGHIPVPVKITPEKNSIVLDSKKTDDTFNLKISSDTHPASTVFLNASSSITPTAELGKLDVKFSHGIVDLSHDSQVLVSVHNGGVLPGNYTLGISASDGYAIKTVFLNLMISK